jgi:hypothetical protein
MTFAGVLLLILLDGESVRFWPHLVEILLTG